jgi:hypothetical protein
MQLHPTHHLRSRARRGVVLLVVLALLTLFAAVGVAFVMFSEQEGNSAQIGLQATQYGRPDPDLLLAYMLNQLVLDTRNSLSALQTQGLLTNTYGPSGYTPFNGCRLHGADPLVPAADKFYLINFGNPPTNPGLRTFNEMMYGGLNPPYTYPDFQNVYLGAVQGSTGLVLARSFVRKGQYYDPANPAFWTTAPTPQQILSVLRPHPLDPLRCNGFPPPADAGGDVKNLPPGSKVWVDQTQPPTAANLADNDSYWIDLGFPDQIGPDGKRYRPLFALFIMDLDNRVNLNAASNIRGNGNNSASSRGYGPWEINLNKILVNYLNPLEPSNGDFDGVFLGTKGIGPVPVQQLGRYGIGATDKTGTTSAQAPIGFGGAFPRVPPIYSQTDLDGCVDDGSFLASNPYSLPGVAPSLAYDRSPRFFNFGNQPTNAPPIPTAPGLGYPYDGIQVPNERTFHPMAFNPLNPGGLNRIFGAYNIEAMLRHGDTGTDAIESDVRRLLPTSFQFPQARWQLTTHSFDIDRPGAIPWNYGTGALLQMNGSNPDILQGGPLAFPAPVGLPVPPNPPPTGEFVDPATGQPAWRSLYAALGKIDLNRPLPDYPRVDQTAPAGGQVTGRLDLTNMVVQNAYLIAQQARQNMARDIFLGFVKAAGAFDLTDPNPAGPPSNAQLLALRWLAQLAVNIVDYIDNDDYMTPFNWVQTGTANFQAAYAAQAGNPGFGPGSDWVLGTELPRLIINEAYAQYTQPVAGSAVDVSTWIELYDSLSDLPAGYPLYYQADSFADVTKGFGPTPLTYGTAKLQNRPTVIAGQTDDRYAIYRVILSQKDTTLRNPDKVLGDPNPALILRKPDPNSPTANKGVCIVGQNQPNVGWNPLVTNEAQDLNYPNADWTNPSGVNQLTGVYTSEVVTPSGTLYAGTNGGNTGFYMLGAGAFPTAAITPTLQKGEMQYRLPAGTNPKTQQNLPTVILQRLACPHIPPQPDPTKQNYNPYVTVDYMEDVKVFQDTDNPRNSVGRLQPYAAFGSGANMQWIPSIDPILSGQQPQNTFFAHNNATQNFALNPPIAGTWPPPITYLPNNYAPTFDWLVHMDRDLISPMELLHVSAYKPHELTQQFMNPTGNSPYAPKFNHYAPWFNEQLRLYRTFEFLECRSPGSGVANITFLPPVGIAAGTQTVDLATGVTNNLLNVALTTYLNQPTGVTPGNGALWTIAQGSILIVDGGGPNEERVLVTAVGGSSVQATFLRNHNNNPSITVPFTRGRQPGKININTVWDKETFRALCDAQQCNCFVGAGPTPDSIADGIFNNFMAPGAGNYAKPFAGYGVGLDPGSQQWPSPGGGLPGLGIANTLLRGNQTIGQPDGPGLPRMLEVPGQNHPYLKTELMTKVFNNTTTRSNVFAVWCTVGFFQVDNAGRLGAEIGRVDGRQLRHRFFAVVDRSALDPWVQMMNALIQKATLDPNTRNPTFVYDISSGIKQVANPPIMPAAPLIIPLQGNTAFDPRKDYSAIPNSLGLPSGPPATVLHWTVIQ